jgi:uncharacterized Rmd1/YagE family protein
MSGIGTYAELRARLGVVSSPVVAPEKISFEEMFALEESMNLPLAPPSPRSPSSPSKKTSAHQTGPQNRRMRRLHKSNEGVESVFAVCLGGSGFDLRALVTMWQLGSPLAMGLSKLVHRLEYVSERADYPVVHAVWRSPLTSKETNLFLMEFGCLVCWGCSRNELTTVIEAVWPFLTSKREKKADIYIDDLNFTVPAGREEQQNELLSFILKDNILLATDDLQEKLAYSYAFAQSVKLDVFERGVAKAIEGMDDFPARMAKYGTLKVKDHSQVAKKIGELFVHGCDVNLRSDVLEVPDILWDMDEVLPVYHLSRKYLEIEERLEILNHRLQVMQEMYAMIQEELHDAQSVRIEWIIIVLIAVNILIEMIMTFLEWLTSKSTHRI